MQSNTSAVVERNPQQTPSTISTKPSTTLKTTVSFYETAAHEFRNKFELPIGLTISSLKLQQNLIDEEHLEVAHAYLDLLEDITNKRAREHLLKELADLVYVCHQMAALLLAQGTGRLIRSVDDRGVVAILDSRIVTKRYGSVLLNSMPPLWRTSDPAIVRDSLKRLKESL